MNKLTIKYNRKDFFGSSIYTEDTKQNFTKADLVKAFLFLSKNNDAAVQVDSMVIYWDCISDCIWCQFCVSFVVEIIVYYNVLTFNILSTQKYTDIFVNIVYKSVLYW